MFQYGDLKERKRIDLNLTRPRIPVEDEGLTGIVRGKKASDLEERFARALSKYRVRFDYQVLVMTAISVPHQEKEVDFIVGRQPVNVHGYIGHFHTIGQRSKDIIRDLHVNEALMPLGFMPIITITAKELGRQEDADMFVRRTFR